MGYHTAPYALPLPSGESCVKNPGTAAATRNRLIAAAAVFLLAGPPALMSLSLADDDRLYDLQYEVTPVPDANAVDVRVRIRQGRHLFREMRFDAGRISDVAGDGEVLDGGGEITWRPPSAGGELRWRASARHERRGGGYDAWIDSDWGLFRAEDIIPRATTRTLRDARSRTTLAFELPERWSVVTEYREVDGHVRVTSEDRRFVQPSGWIVVGELGVRREHVAGTRVAVAAPTGHDVRRMDMLALLNWTLPELSRILPEPLPRLTIISAGEPMWRGGLSAPASLYLHADRPLISENGTSTLLHEVMHVAMGLSATQGYDWIVEGFAEYYSLQLLYRSGSITPSRYRSALTELAGWADSAESLCGRSSSGAETAMAVTVLHALDNEILAASGTTHSLDDVLVDLLVANRKVTLDALRGAASERIGRNPNALHIRRLPGCGKVGTGN